MSFLSQITSGTQNTIGAFNTMTAQSIPRASYVIASANSTSTWYGAVFLDAEFRRIGHPGNSLTSVYSNGFTNDMDQYNTTYITQLGQMFHPSMSPYTQTSMSSSGYTLPIPGTASMGEYGQGAFMGSERGIIMSSHLRFYTTSSAAPIRANRAFVNSDHTNKKQTIQFSGGYLTVCPIQTPICYTITSTDPFYRPKYNVAPIFTTYDAGSQTTTMYGSASYNAVRKELMVATFTSTTAGRVNVAIWKNFDFDAVNGNIALLAASPDVLLNTTLASWTETNEGRYNSKWTLVDDGSIFVSSFNEGYNTGNLWKITRATGDASLSNTLINTQSGTTSYGYDQGENYGQRQVQTRQGNMTCSFFPYYYYQCGMRGWVIDKRNSSWVAAPSNDNTTCGSYPVKYRSNGFMFTYNSNYYASNYTGNYNAASSFPSTTTGAAPTVYSFTMYYPVAPGPNTTNYPGISHVWEYDLQSDLPY